MSDETETLFQVSGGTEEERHLMIRETARVLRWRAVSNMAIALGIIGAFVLTCPVVCG